MPERRGTGHRAMRPPSAAMMAPIHSHITSGETSMRNVDAHGCVTNRWAISLMSDVAQLEDRVQLRGALGGRQLLGG